MNPLLHAAPGRCTCNTSLTPAGQLCKEHLRRFVVACHEDFGVAPETPEEAEAEAMNLLHAMKLLATWRARMKIDDSD